MIRLISISLLSLLLLFSSSVCSAKEEKTWAAQNRYNGKTIEYNYGENDEEYKNGIVRVITHYDKHGKIKEIESCYSEAQISIDGIECRVQFYEHRAVRKPRLTKSVFLYSQSYSDLHGRTRAEIHYDEKGNKIKEEFWYHDAFAARKNYSRVEVFYNKGAAEKRVYYDRNGTVISREEKKEVWKSE